MANVISPTQSENPWEKARVEEMGPAVPASPAPSVVPAANETPVYCGDRIALQVWLIGCVLLWVMALSNLLSNLWSR